MKRITFLLFLLVGGLSVEAQIVKGEAFLGLNLCQVDGDEVAGYRKYGLHGGLGAIVPLFKAGSFSFEGCLEVTYDQKGAHQGPQYNDNGDGRNGAYDLDMNYVTVPLIFYVTDKELLSIGVGASYGRLFGIKEHEHSHQTEVSLNSGHYDKNDFDVILDAKLRIYQRLKVGVRFQYSMVKIRTRDFTYLDDSYTWTRDQFNNVVTLRAIWVFNEDKSKLIREEYEYTGDNPKFHERKVARQLRKLQRKQERLDKK